MTVEKPTDDVAAEFLRKTFPMVDDRVRSGDLRFDDVVAIARAAVDELYPDAVCAFIYGSSAAGRFKPFSDLDIAVFLPSGQEWSLACIERDGFLLEIHSYPVETVGLMISFARFTGQIFALVVARDGIVLLDRDGTAEPLRERFAEAFEAGPLSKPVELTNDIRFHMTAALLDLAAATQPDEMLCIGNLIYGHIVRLVQTLDRQWQHNGKWAVRDIAKNRPQLLADLRVAMAALCEGRVGPLYDIGIGLLDEVGGGRWAGHHASFAISEEAKLMPVLKLLRARII